MFYDVEDDDYEDDCNYDDDCNDDDDDSLSCLSL